MNSELSQIQSRLPAYVKKVGNILSKEGHKAYLVGGSLRDMLMGKEPKDYDIGTDATPEDITKIFPKSIATGAKFGSIIVLMQDEKGETHEVDVTTFRIDHEYLSGRWPSKVTFTTDIIEDLSRRDFTINAMAFDLSREDSETLLDPFGGQEDIQKKIIRAVGNPLERLTEDALRALRACRFASVLEFHVDPPLKEAIPEVLSMIDNLSAERVRDEFLKILYNSPKPSVGLRLLFETGILKIWIPELLEGIGVEQPTFHVYDVFEHSLRTVDIAEDSVKLAALFHDIGKPRTQEGEHFYRHDIVGAQMTKEIMERLRFSKKEIERVVTLVRWHMFYYPYDEEAFAKGDAQEEEMMKKKRKLGVWTDGAVRRFIKNVGGQEAIDKLFKLRIADATANPKSSFDATEIELLETRISAIRAQDAALKVSDLDINGHDLQKLGVESGPKVGEILNNLLEEVLEDPSLNDKDKLITLTKEKYLPRQKTKEKA